MQGQKLRTRPTNSAISAMTMLINMAYVKFCLAILTWAVIHIVAMHGAYIMFHPVLPSGAFAPLNRTIVSTSYIQGDADGLAFLPSMAFYYFQL